MNDKQLHSLQERNRLIALQAMHPNATHQNLAKMFYGVMIPRGYHVMGIKQMVKSIERENLKNQEFPELTNAEFLTKSNKFRYANISKAFIVMDQYLFELKNYVDPDSPSCKVLDELQIYEIKLEIRRVAIWMKHKAKHFKIAYEGHEHLKLYTDNEWYIDIVQIRLI